MSAPCVRRLRAVAPCVAAAASVFLGVCLVSAPLALGQETRGTIFGRILDPSSAAVADVKVTVVNTETNVSTRITSNRTGYYEASLLIAGTYRVTAEAPGFKTMVRGGVVLSVGSRRQVDVHLEMGAMADQILVTAELPLLETSTVPTGQIVDNRSIQDLPVPGGNSVTLAKLVPGIQSVDSLSDKTVRLHSNGAGSRYAVGGNVGGNEYSVDGIPNGGNGRNIAYMPAPELVEEFKVETGNFDASMGHGTGVNVSMMTKSGSNQMHGQLRWTHHQTRWEANEYFREQARNLQISQAEAKGDLETANRLRSEPVMPSGRTNNYSATLGGPLVVPGVINGRNKLFFFVGFTGFRVGEYKGPFTVTVPTEAMRNGDFSQLLRIVDSKGVSQAAKYQIYDPLTVKADPARSGHYVRQSFAGNIIPRGRIISPMFDFYNQLLPLPNVDLAADAEPVNNHITYASPYTENYYAVANRIDFAPSSRDRFFVRWSINSWKNYDPGWLWDSPLRDRVKTGATRTNYGIMLDWVRRLGASSMLDLSVSTNQYNNSAYVTNPTMPSDVGLPAYMDAVAGPTPSIPGFQISGMNGYDNGSPGYDKYRNFTAKADVYTVRGSHTFRSGVEARQQYRNVSSPGRSSGLFTFTNAYTRHYDDNYGLTQSAVGLGWASFLLGIPETMAVPTNDTSAFSTPYFAAYVQDAWRLNDKLTLNLGLRAEYELGMKERYNRALSTFDPSLSLPISAGAQAAYAAAPIPELPASQFVVKGGSVYTSQSPGNRVYDNSFTLLPKLSAVYQLTPKTVLSAGYGLSVDTLNALAVGAPDTTGYSRTTTTKPSNDYGMTWLSGNPAAGIAPIADPFPLRPDGNRFDQLVRDSFGALAKVGRGPWNATPYDRPHARQHRWRVGVQQQLGKNMVVSVAYLGTYSDRIGINQTLSYLPEEYWADGLVRNDALASQLTANVTNPFYIGNFASLAGSDPVLYADMAANSFFSSKTIQKNKLLRAYPQMNGIGMNQPIGEVKTNEIDFSLQRRFSGGLSFSLAYTRLWAKETFLLDEFDTETTWRESNWGRPHRATATVLYELPFGKNRAFLKSGVLSQILGDFQASVLFEYQPGPLIDWGTNLFYYGDLNDIAIDNPTPQKWFNTDNFETDAKKVPASYHRRVFPTRVDGVRADYIHNWNLALLRSFHFTSRTSLQIRADLMNVFNRTQFDAPEVNPTSSNFGTVLKQPALTGSGYGACNRWFQITARLQF